MIATSPAQATATDRAEATWSALETPSVIHLVEQDPEVQDMVTWLFESAGWTVREYASVEAFLDAPRPVGDACLVVELAQPGLSGLDLLERLNAEGTQMPAVVLTELRDAGSAVAALKAGACDFLAKPADQEKLFSTVTGALDRHREARAREEACSQAKARLAQLTARELEVLEMILDGKPNKIIAADLDINIRTVENHRAQVMRKTGVASLPALVKLYLASLGSDGLDPGALV
ncbi:MAG: response regulator transcription factor [Rhodobacterales bacterium]